VYVLSSTEPWRTVTFASVRGTKVLGDSTLLIAKTKNSLCINFGMVPPVDLHADIPVMRTPPMASRSFSFLSFYGLVCTGSNPCHACNVSEGSGVDLTETETASISSCDCVEKEESARV